jgi:hypothetical protein
MAVLPSGRLVAAVMPSRQTIHGSFDRDDALFVFAVEADHCRLADTGKGHDIVELCHDSFDGKGMNDVAGAQIDHVESATRGDGPLLDSDVKSQAFEGFVAAWLGKSDQRKSGADKRKPAQITRAEAQGLEILISASSVRVASSSRQPR